MAIGLTHRKHYFKHRKPNMTSPCSVFTIGKHGSKLIDIAANDKLQPPKPLLIACPMDEGEYPVLILLHGFLLSNTYYSQLIQHVASHGFIVVAPQLDSIHSKEELESAAGVTNWLAVGLDQSLPHKITPNLSKLAISGHSQGGKMAFALALKYVETKLKYSALIGIDPVDGRAKGSQTKPPILTYISNSLETQMPNLVIGSGLGGVKKDLLLPPCAPAGVSHQDFFDDTCQPKWHFVGKEYGHMDMLDDETVGFTCLCKSGKCRKPMREFVGGVMVAFLDGYLNGNMKDLLAIADHLVDAPIEFSVTPSL